MWMAEAMSLKKIELNISDSFSVDTLAIKRDKAISGVRYRFVAIGLVIPKDSFFNKT
jgi:hypothetical protein